MKIEPKMRSDYITHKDYVLLSRASTLYPWNFDLEYWRYRIMENYQICKDEDYINDCDERECDTFGFEYEYQIYLDIDSKIKKIAKHSGFRNSLTKYRLLFSFLCENNSRCKTKLFEILTNLYPTDPIILFELGYHLQINKKYDDAIRCYIKSLEYGYPYRYIIYENSADCWNKKNNIDNALIEMTNAINIYQRTYLLMKRASVYINVAEKKKAYDDYTTVINICNSHVVKINAYLSRAECGSPLLIADLESAMNIDPAEYDNVDLVTNLLLDHNMEQEAVKFIVDWIKTIGEIKGGLYYDCAEKLYEKNMRYIRKITQLLLNNGKIEDALSFITICIGLHKDAIGVFVDDVEGLRYKDNDVLLSDCYLYRAEIYCKVFKLNEAINDYLTILDMNYGEYIDRDINILEEIHNISNIISNRTIDNDDENDGNVDDGNVDDDIFLNDNDLEFLL